MIFSFDKKSERYHGSDPTCEGRNYVLNWVFLVFFIQTNLADRYVHRRELWVVSLKSSSSVEFEIKKIFLIRFFWGAIEF